MLEENNYLKALVEINQNHYFEKTWLFNHFWLYKQTLNWPENLPPIRRSDLAKGTLKEKFSTTYKEILDELEFGYILNNEEQSLKIYLTEFYNLLEFPYSFPFKLCIYKN